MKNIKKHNQGFTIIEVMIVLVIAAVILLIVFLAVPALQRNARNTERKRDALRVSSAILEYAQTDDDGIATNTEEDKERLLEITGDLSFYETSTVAINVQTPTEAVNTANGLNNNLDNVSGDALAFLEHTLVVIQGLSCNQADHVVRAQPNSVTIVYTIETSSVGGYAPACV